MKNYSIPDGMRDAIFNEALLYSRITERLNDLYTKNGFMQISTPAVEYYDVFGNDSQAIGQESMYKLTDKNGRLIVLRADNTMPISRVAATKLVKERMPLKIFYSQNIYRISSDYSGRRREILQSGIEYIGTNTIKTDVICLRTALEALSTLGLEYKIEIGHVGLFNSLISELTVSDEIKRNIRGYVDSKNTVSLEMIDDSSLDRIRRLPLLYGGKEVFPQAMQTAGDNAGAIAAIEYVKSLYETLESAGYGENLLVDMGIVHEIDYYTGLVFRGYIKNAGEAVLSGGRYDDLISNFGVSLPATGFAINLSLAVDALISSGVTEEYPSIDCIIHFDISRFAEAEKTLERLTAEGKNVILSPFSDSAETKEYAFSNGIGEVIEI